MIDKKGALYTAKTLELTIESVEKVLQLLLNEDCTIAFICRYRKEATGGLDEVQVGAIEEHYNHYLEREKRRQFILETIQSQDKLTEELKRQIVNANTLNQLEDLYAPYKSKRKTKAQLAIEAGLAPLAELVKTSQLSLEELLIKHEKEFFKNGLESREQLLEGVQAIISEEIVHNADLKETLRKDYWQNATLKSEKKKDAEKLKDADKFKDYFDFEQKISELRAPKASHRFLAMRRGMLLKILKVSVNYQAQDAIGTIKKMTFDLDHLGCSDFLINCIERAYQVSIHSSLDLEVKGELKLLCDESAIDVFGINLKNLLLQPYLGQKAVLGIDPGIRTGCKIAVIDKNGDFLADTVIYPHGPKNDISGSKRTIETCIEKLGINYIAIGNGTFGRETLHFIQHNIEQVKNGRVKAMLVNEDGASIYSASDIARKEFPDKDLTIRGAISIARRFQDPLGELVKIDPKSIGVGQYQHDVNQPKLKKSLTGVVENCVNFVGVDLNTASAPLLSYISGVGPTLADNIVKYRSKTSGFKNRQELLKVARFTPKVFEQSAGFMRIYGAENPFDGTFIHPERYDILTDWCKKNGITKAQLIGNKEKVEELKKDIEFKKALGEFTLEDIAKSLLAASQDPRTEFVSFEFRKDAIDFNSIKEGEYYPGVVTNITQFGAFVDIGIKENGLIHVSQIADKFVSNALEFLKVGQEVKARVLQLDRDRKRIALSLKSEAGAVNIKRPGKNEKKAKTAINKASIDQVAKNNPLAALKNFKV